MDPLEHLTSLVTNIPSWLVILDEQKEQLGRRQAELALLSESSLEHSYGPSSPSLKNKGSAESLRPKATQVLEEEEENEEAIANDEPKDAVILSELKRDSDPSAQIVRSKSQTTPLSPQALQRRPSNKFSPRSTLHESPAPVQATHPPQGRLLKRRKSKASSVHSKHSSQSQASNTSSHPAKFNRSKRTRSMINVYYDSFVQDAFENLVRHISTARNTLRKGKMAERMGRIRMLAELEDMSGEEVGMNISTTNERKAPPVLPALSPIVNRIPSVGANGAEFPVFKPSATVLEKSQGPIEADDESGEDEDFMEKPRLQFKSTRMMGASRAVPEASGMRLSSLNTSSAVGLQRPGIGPAANGSLIAKAPTATTTTTPPSASPASKTNAGGAAGLRGPAEDKCIYDKLEKSLEWCQATCERAAHRSLRDGECYSEIAGIRKRLEDLSVQARAEIRTATAAAADGGQHEVEESRNFDRMVRMRGGGSGGADAGSVRARQMRDPVMRIASTLPRTSNTDAGAPPVARGRGAAPHEDEGLGVEMEADDVAATMPPRHR